MEEHDDDDVVNDSGNATALCVAKSHADEVIFSTAVERRIVTLSHIQVVGSVIGESEEKNIENLKVMLRYEDAMYKVLELRRKFRTPISNAKADNIIERLPDLPREEAWKIIRYEYKYGKYALIRLGSKCRNYQGATDLKPGCPTPSMSLYKYYIRGEAFVNSQKSREGNALHTAVRFEKLDIVRYLVQQTDVRVNDKDKDGYTPLVISASHRSCEIFKYLVTEAKAKYNRRVFYEAAFHCNKCIINFLGSYNHVGNIERNQFPDGKSYRQTLYRAASCGSVDLVKFLVNNGYDVNARDSSNNKTALHAAAEHGHFPVVTYLVNNASANVSIRDRDGYTVLEYAARRGHLDINMFLVKFLVNNGYDVNASQSSNNMTSLHLAAYYGYLPVVTYLVNNASANASIRDKYGNTALVYAARRGHLAITMFLVKSLVNDGYDVNAKQSSDDDDTALHLAIEYGQFPVVAYLINNASANASIRDKHGNTALRYAAIQGHLNIYMFLVKSLVNNGDDINTKQSSDGGTALHIAAYYGYFPVVTYLVNNASANTSIRDKYGETALMVAAYRGHLDITMFLGNIDLAKKDKDSISRSLINAAYTNNLDIVKYLVTEAHADLFANTYVGYNTVLEAASKQNNINIIKYLVGERGIIEINGETALHIAAKCKYLDIVKYLVLDIGMDVTAKNNDGETPLQVAKKEEDKSSNVIEWLEKHMT